jgi:hypothetical protein
MSLGKILCVLLLSACAWAQTLSEGSTTSLQVLPNPLNNTFTWDFELCCGEPSGAGGYLGNGFGYADGQFNAFFAFAGQKKGFSFTGTVSTVFTPQAIGEYCTVQSMTLKNAQITTQTGMFYGGLVATYSQMFCQRAGVYWLGPGGLVVNAP